MEHHTDSPIPTQDARDNRVIAALSYISILCLVPLLLKRDSAFAQWHAKQGLVLVIAAIINFFIGIIPILGSIAIFGVIAIVVLSLIGIMKALNGELWEAPYVAEYAKKLNV